MDDLRNRLQTFVNWPQHVLVKPKLLAEAGFYYVGTTLRDDTVCCFDCKGKLNNWKATDIPERRHREHFGQFCPFVQQARDVLDTPSSWQDTTESHYGSYDNGFYDDMENEEQRLRSFQRNNGWLAPVPPRKLAAAGFYFTGIGDTVKCFACDVSLARWEAEDDPISEHLKSEPNCPFLPRWTARQRMLSSGIMGGTQQQTEVYHHNRPNYTESVRIMRNDPPRQSAFRSGLNLPEPNYFQIGTTAPMQPQHQGGFPGSVYAPPNYASEHARLHSFINWPKECPVQPKELIDAGFYYTGEDDKVQCFKCNVILAGWDPEDTPWGEHKRWSKDCPLVNEYLLRRNPHSPLSENSETAQMPKEQFCESSKEGFSSQSVRPGPCESECFDNMTTKAGRLPKEQSDIEAFQDLDIAKAKKGKGQKLEVFHLQKGMQELVDRGYDLAKIEEAIKHRQKVCGESIESTDELLDAVVSFMETNSTCNPQGKSTADEQADAVKDPKTGESSVDSGEAAGLPLLVNPQSLHRQFEKMQEARMCSICFDAEIGVVFLPCGHLVCCAGCATEIQSKPSPLCPLCRTSIHDSISIFFA